MVNNSKDFPHGGIYILRHNDIYLLVNAASTGVNGLGPHKHNDTLSFELCIGDQPIIIDPGTFCYTGNPEIRQRFRSTAYHNTLLVDETEQNDLPKTLFGLNKNQIHPKVNSWQTDSQLDLLDVEHDGYSRLRNPVIHRRIFRLKKEEGRLEIKDNLFGSGRHEVSFFWHFHPDIAPKLKHMDERYLYVNVGSLSLSFQFDADLKPNLIDGWYSERYNHKVPNKVFCLDGKNIPFPLELIFSFSIKSARQT